MTNDNEKTGLSFFDRSMGILHDLPDVVSTRPSTIGVVPVFGIGTQTYIVQTYRQREVGDTIFIQWVADGVAIRMPIPPAVADLIARQRDQLTAKSRSKAGKQIAETLKEKGIKPGFMKKKS